MITVFKFHHSHAQDELLYTEVEVYMGVWIVRVSKFTLQERKQGL